MLFSFFFRTSNSESQHVLQKVLRDRPQGSEQGLEGQTRSSWALLSR